jgi:enoyl-CoA hydratase/carnithine racemase
MNMGVRVDKDGSGILSVTLSRPDRRNAFDEDMIDRLLTIYSHEAHAADVRALVLRGQDGHFSAGFDLKSRAQKPLVESMRQVGALYAAIAAAPVLTVALVEGVAFGGAVGLIAASDLVIAARSARFACPEGRHGLLPAVMATFLTRAIGPRHAMAMVATAGAISAEQALCWGLVSELVEDASALETRRAELIDQIVRTGPAMSRSARVLISLASGGLADDAMLERAIAMAVESRKGEEACEGIRAFREGRRPKWADGV